MAEHEPWIERIIREAAETGAFDDLEGRGRPIPDLDEPYDPAWWARRWLRRNRELDAVTEVAAEVSRRLPRVLAGGAEVAVRAGLEELNGLIAALDASVEVPARLGPLPIDRILAGWRTRHGQTRDRPISPGSVSAEQ